MCPSTFKGHQDGYPGQIRQNFYASCLWDRIASGHEVRCLVGFDGVSDQRRTYSFDLSADRNRRLGRRKRICPGTVATAADRARAYGRPLWRRLRVDRHGYLISLHSSRGRIQHRGKCPRVANENRMSPLGERFQRLGSEGHDLQISVRSSMTAIRSSCLYVVIKGHGSRL